MFGPLGLSRYVDYAGDINVSGKHHLDLINDSLDVSRILRRTTSPSKKVWWT